MKDDPEEGAERDGEEIIEGEEPRVGELRLVARRADHGKDESNQRQDSE